VDDEPVGLGHQAGPRRQFFDRILAQAVASSFGQSDHATCDAWQVAVARSEVRLQWDPDHDPHGKPLARRAIQLGLKGAILAEFGQRELVEAIDMSEFVTVQRERLARGEDAQLSTPVEHVYRPSDPAIAQRLRLD
jgi:hypothetical protein